MHIWVRMDDDNQATIGLTDYLKSWGRSMACASPKKGKTSSKTNTSAWWRPKTAAGS